MLSKIVFVADIINYLELEKIAYLKNNIIDVLINNAGAGGQGTSITNTDSNKVEKQFLVHCLGAFNVAKAALIRNFGQEVTDIVYRVTDEPGADRTERKHKTYHKIRGRLDATTVKLCDRIANVEASADVPYKLNMYRNEHRDFRKVVRFPDHEFLLGGPWRYLDRLLGLEYE